MESVMSEQISEQAEKMREMAQTTLDKAKEAVSKYMTESHKLREKADSGVRATYSTTKEMNDRRWCLLKQMWLPGSSLRKGYFCQRPAGNGRCLSKSSQGTDGKNECAVS